MEKNLPKSIFPHENFLQVFLDKVINLEIFLFLNLSWTPIKYSKQH